MESIIPIKSLPDKDQLIIVKRIIHSLQSSIAVLDEKGTIIFVNRSWQKFARLNGANPEKVSEGTNYLDVCDSVKGADRHGALKFANNLTSILSGISKRFEFEYECRSPQKLRWFVCRVTRFEYNGNPHVIVGHVEDTEKRLLEANQKKAEKSLKKIGTAFSTGFKQAK